ncbi:hypothetical protein [Bosea sp. BK604]|uniref:lysozyme inhibitor LprI family protein n=1 Tax=Bosea sp. BK604 TaxID=2512180 RepID=UPI0010459FAD|nr:hypothetical protein [Bosea sp. BK604]TCR60642.1 hypothetical protein EV560_116129 [Bosea sp. BK604]
MKTIVNLRALGLLGVVALLFSAAAASSSTAAASFDCRNASLPAEKRICADANLASLDERTAGMYFVIVGSGAPAATVARVKQMQSRFIARRNACQANTDCLVDAYTDQMMFLRNEKSTLGL